MTLTTVLKLTDLVTGAGGHATQNSSNRRLEAHVHLSVINRTQTSEPGSPAEGDAYIAGTGVTGWTGELDGVASQTYVAGDIIVLIGGGWVGWTPIDGFRAYVEAEEIAVVYDTAWRFDGSSRVTTGLTANAGGGQGSAVQLNFGRNVIATVATTGDSVKLPAAEASGLVIVSNDGANSADVFPSSGDSINSLAVNTALALAVDKTALYWAANATNWYALVSA